MSPFSIPFHVAAEQIPGLVSGDIVRYGAILKDASTGRILAHVQETGAAQAALQAGLSIDPTGATGLIGVAQNAQISKKLDTMQQTMGTIQHLQIATLLSSVIGIGVTAVSTKMIINRLGGINSKIDSMEDKFKNILKERDMSNLQSKLITSLERQLEAEKGLRKKPEKAFYRVEEQCHGYFNHIYGCIYSMMDEINIDVELLRMLIGSLALCGNCEIKALLMLDEKGTALERAQSHYNKLENLAFKIPMDQLEMRLSSDAKQASMISEDILEIRHRFASQPELIRLLIDRDISGRQYIKRFQDENKEPLLFLPV